jgi:hypothetical protein
VLPGNLLMCLKMANRKCGFPWQNTAKNPAQASARREFVIPLRPGFRENVYRKNA